ncbi:MAG: DoxX family membrane protein [Ignavibacteriae bacterium]|nr:DoxX family membrane protein [Ignavibacteriota bacterium]
MVTKTLNVNQKVTFNSLYFQFSSVMSKYGIDLLRIALAIVFIWFGGLKIFGMSPAQELVEKTIYWLPPKFFVPFLGYWEVAMGLGLLVKRLIPLTIILMLFHMAGTFLPFIILTKVCFDVFPYCPSLAGQYIIKNLVLVAGALTVAGKYNGRIIRKS